MEKDILRILTYTNFAILSVLAFTQCTIESVPDVSILDKPSSTKQQELPRKSLNPHTEVMRFVRENGDYSQPTKTTHREAMWISYKFSDEVFPDTNLVAEIELGLTAARALVPDLIVNFPRPSNALLIKSYIACDTTGIANDVNSIFGIVDSTISQYSEYVHLDICYDSLLARAYVVREELNYPALRSELVKLQDYQIQVPTENPYNWCGSGGSTYSGFSVRQIEEGFEFEFSKEYRELLSERDGVGRTVIVQYQDKNANIVSDRVTRRTGSLNVLDLEDEDDEQANQEDEVVPSRKMLDSLK